MTRHAPTSVKLCAARCFGRDEEGAALLETIIILPVMIVFLVGILEFGALLYNKMQVETGLRDAARYVARCPQDPGFSDFCDADVARNLAVFGNVTGNGTPRARDWRTQDVDIPNSLPAIDQTVRVSTSFTYRGSPLIRLINLVGIPVAAYHDERVIGW